MNRFQLVRSGAARQAENRYSLDQYIYDAANLYGGGTGGLIQSWTPDKNGRQTERSDSPFEHWVANAYKANGIVFACQVARLSVFSQARFQFQQLRGGRPGDLFGTPELGILEVPWVNGATGDLLARMIQDADFAGNAYVRRADPTADYPGVERLRPDWVDIVLGSSPGRLTRDVLGYLYFTEGPSKPDSAIALTREEVAHWAPYPDPIASYRGMSWLTPVLRDVQADRLATEHKKKFFENGGTVNMVVKFDSSISPEKLERFRELMESEHRGVANAYKTLYLGGGADATVVGADFKQMDFKNVQGGGETRVAAAARVPPIIAGLSEGLAASTYSNYAQARRHFADGCQHPLWSSVSAALQSIVRVPAGSRLWYDHHHIAFLREDEKDAAEIESVKSTTIANLVREGFEPDSVVKAVMAQDMSLLVHSGRVSVQLLEPGEQKSSMSTNGHVPQGVSA